MFLKCGEYSGSLVGVGFYNGGYWGGGWLDTLGGKNIVNKVVVEKFRICLVGRK